MRTFLTTSSALQWRISLKGGDEFDALTGWRRVISFKAGERSRIKRGYRRRLRHALNVCVAQLEEQEISNL